MHEIIPIFTSNFNGSKINSIDARRLHEFYSKRKPSKCTNSTTKNRQSISFTNCTTDGRERKGDFRKNRNHSTFRKCMIVDCKVCNGKGIVYKTKKEWDLVAINPLIVACTFGLSLVDAKEDIEYKKICDTCGGTGVLKIKEINQK